MGVLPPASITRHWQYSTDPSFATYSEDLYQGTQFYIASFNSNPGYMYFRLIITSSAGCASVTSNPARLHVIGSPPTPFYNRGLPVVMLVL
ncbi:MAG: hypothetical protein IPJ37_02835 [Bacteroidales bacterium]|nr:hypothetical protein [Bacteroidales bacterium]